MTNGLRKAWTELVQPLLRRPPEHQVAALCWREAEDADPGDIEVLLITSRDTGRWIVPKGWPIDGLTGAEAAAREAWEEAGVTGSVQAGTPIGSYDYGKTQDQGYDLAVQVQVFKLHAQDLSDDFPECSERRRSWVSPAKAATMVRERGLQNILRAL
ncbi:NUDIX hydrolase [Pelagivirga sediminicola]|uniref:NUDIX hydrolase n=1 Tax=Pelagivirga sediminicola TaxID=2170575 RepID=A0A2T7GAI2_9RHOB|nr:NUDIX hydrolase [Pelagivirga sediminicola]PVA11406.1 NUDIX hydrolase [Pelagivirga sediminicola]